MAEKVEEEVLLAADPARLDALLASLETVVGAQRAKYGSIPPGEEAS